MRHLFIKFFFLCLFSISSLATVLKQSKDTMSVGGVITFPIEWDTIKGPSLLINLAPEFGIFLFDRFELLTRVHYKTSFNRRLNFEKNYSLHRWGLGLGFQYSFKTHNWPVIPFIGCGIDYEMSKLNIFSADALINMPVGILVPLSESFALSIGLATKIYLVAQLKVFDKIQFEPGFLGVKAYF